MSATSDTEARRQIEHLEALIQGLDQLEDPAARDQARELVQTLLDFHGEGVKRILDRIGQLGDAGHDLIASLSGDEVVSNLMLLYGLHPVELESRVSQALDKVRPYLQSHRGGVELVSVIDGVVRLRMQGSCHGCPSSAITLKNAIEEAIFAAAPDVVTIEVDEAASDHDHASEFLPIVTLEPRLAAIRSSALPA